MERGLTKGVDLCVNERKTYVAQGGLVRKENNRMPTWKQVSW